MFTRKRVYASLAMAISIPSIFYAYNWFEELAKKAENWRVVAIEPTRGCTIINEVNLTLSQNNGERRPLTLTNFRQNVVSDFILSNSHTNDFTIENVWVNPNKVNSVSRIKSSADDINLLESCENKIREGYKDPVIQVALFYLYTKNAEIKNWLKKYANNEMPDAYVLLGHAYDRGIVGATKDEAKAIVNYIKAANLGSPQGQLYAAKSLKKQNPVLAAEYILRAAKSGYFPAIYMLQDKALSARSREEKKLAYFWHLVFKTKDKFSVLQNYKYAMTPSLPNGYRFYLDDHLLINGFPELKGFFNYRRGDALSGEYYWEQWLTLDERIQIQKKAEYWINKQFGHILSQQ